MMTKNGDIVSELIGDWGPWQFRTVILIYLCKIPSAWFMACLIFTAPVPQPAEVACNHPETEVVLHQHSWPAPTNTTHTNVAPVDFCFQLNRTSLDSRNWADDENDGQTVPCTSFRFDTPFETTVTKFDLVCLRSILVPTSQFFHLFGVLTGGILAVKLMQTISPRTLMLHGMVFQIVFGCFAALVCSYEIHMLLRYLASVCCAQMYTAGQLICIRLFLFLFVRLDDSQLKLSVTDITGSKYRITSVCFFENFWSIGIILLPGIAFIDPNWSSISLMISLPTIFYIPIWWLIPDTPRWFLTKGRVDEAVNIIKHAVTVNNTKNLVSESVIRQRLSNSVSLSAKQEPPAKWPSLWNDRRAVVPILAVHVAWAVYVTNYNGMLLNVKAFGRDHLSVNTVALGCSEIVGVFIGYLLIVNCKKKWQYTGVFNIFAGFVASIGYLYPNSLSADLRTGLVMLTAIIPKIAVSCSLSILFSCTAELVPPAKRKTLVFSCVVWARICLLTAPYIGILMDKHQLLPLSVFGVLSAIGGVCTCLVTTSRTFAKEEHPETELPTACVPGRTYCIPRSLWGFCEATDLVTLALFSESIIRKRQ